MTFLISLGNTHKSSKKCLGVLWCVRAIYKKAEGLRADHEGCILEIEIGWREYARIRDKLVRMSFLQNTFKETWGRR